MQFRIKRAGRNARNWRVIRDHLINGLTYNYIVHNDGTITYSIDEELVASEGDICISRGVTTGKYPASELVDSIGQDVFIHMINGCFNYDVYHMEITPRLNKLIHTFMWGRWANGYEGWLNVSAKLKVIERRYD